MSDPFPVNTVTTGEQLRPAVAGNDDGNFLVVWHSDAVQAGFFDIKGQLVDRNRAPIGAEFQVDQAAANRIQYTPQAAAGGDGNYTVVWADFNSTVTDSEVWMRRYDSAGNALGGAVQVNTFTTGKQRQPRVSANDAGDFVVVWESAGQDGSGYGVVARLYGADGAPATGEILVNTYTTGNQNRPDVDMDDEGYTVIFNNENTGVDARDMGLVVSPAPSGGGPPQFNVFDIDHRNGEVSRLAMLLNPGGGAPSNTLFIAENHETGRVSGRRQVAGVLGQQFTIANGSSPTMAWTGFELPPGVPGFQSPRGLPIRGGGVICTVVPVVLVYGLVCQKYWTDLDGVPFEVGPPGIIPWDTLGFIAPIVSIGDAQALVIGARQNEKLAGGGGGSEIEAVAGGSPNAFAISPNPPTIVIPPDTATALGATLGNFTSVPMTLSGTLQAAAPLTSSPQSLTIDDGTADYGTIAPSTVGACQDCYGVTAAGPRPALHWDEAASETLSTGVHKTWLLHVGQSFADVPDTNPFYLFIETLLHNGITAGGACGGYCPTDGVKRQQMAVFLIKSRFGASVVPPPATGTVFTDVPLSNPFAAWIELLYLLGITGGCSGGPPPAPIQYCPDAIVNRQQMSAFLLKMLEGPAYVPPPPTGIFQDVPDTNIFRPFIEELYNRQITGGCVPVPLQYCPGNPTNRQQMAAFLTKTFGLQLYGP
jgi:hypothetical protein